MRLNTADSTHIHGLPLSATKLYMCPSSMAWEVSNKDLSTLENPEYFERINWLNNLAYCQWREDECKAGLPWEHLKKVYQDVISK